MRLFVLGLLALLAGCQPPPDAHVPAFARKPYEPFSRDAVVAIALREWRLFGQRVNERGTNDTQPDAPRLPGPKAEREQGLWQRIGEYWWLGSDMGREEAGWTGAHDISGGRVPVERDGDIAWSAAFISYVMRIAGAGPRFPYASAHWVYIDAAKRPENGLLAAERPEAVAPLPGDLICAARERDRTLRYDNLPGGPYLSHCDIVVAVAPGEIRVVGGNVEDAVTMKHVPVTPEGRLATPDGRVLDPDRAWMVVLRLRV